MTATGFWVALLSQAKGKSKTANDLASAPLASPPRSNVRLPLPLTLNILEEPPPPLIMVLVLPLPVIVRFDVMLVNPDEIVIVPLKLFANTIVPPELEY